MTVKTFTFSPFQENTYLAYDETGESIIIDAGMFYEREKAEIVKYMETHKLSLIKVINTHLHLDHQFGNKFLFDTFAIAPEASEEDEFLLATAHQSAQMFGLPYKEAVQPLGKYLTDGDEIKFGNSSMICLSVPGHSPGSLAFYNQKEGIVFTGDALFNGSIGRTDLGRGDYSTLIRSIQEKLLTLPDNTVVYSGHGPKTTIGNEKKNNPFL
ncbi:MAG TPA: MBL fold metallo-hydrolase [Paludibacteraceae bacterium]|nr:MBL fold metallo-hydrolase [Paludibacteraceae bacterium]HPT43170.1 MBL fold metallo-hydrolase [Paludibacteraceae bacterium]